MQYSITFAVLYLLLLCHLTLYQSIRVISLASADKFVDEIVLRYGD